MGNLQSFTYPKVPANYATPLQREVHLSSNRLLCLTQVIFAPNLDGKYFMNYLLELRIYRLSHFFNWLDHQIAYVVI